MANPSSTLNTCPIPEVADSLAPYIKTRQDVAHIRQALHSSLPLSPLNASQGLLNCDVDPSSLTGVRKAYWRALQAHRAAESEYDSLKAELESLVREGNSTDATVDDPSALLTESYMPFVRRKEKYRKLAIIDKTAAGINVTGGDSLNESFDKVVKRQVGELPAPPSMSAFADRETGNSSEHDLTELKRTILTTKQQIDEHEMSMLEIEELNNHDIDPRADLRGLQRAHKELTGWMESQLALISDANGPSEDSQANESPSETNGNGTDSSVEIEVLYERYLAARQRLLSTVADPPSTNFEAADLQLSKHGSDLNEAEKPPRISEILLPYLPGLLSVKAQEQTILHQAAFSRRQLASAELQTEAVLIRLADESHLVEPGLNREKPCGKDWSKAAAAASEATSNFSLQRVTSGKVSVEAASRALETIRDMPTTLDSFSE